MQLTYLFIQRIIFGGTKRRVYATRTPMIRQKSIVRQNTTIRQKSVIIQKPIVREKSSIRQIHYEIEVR